MPTSLPRTTKALVLEKLTRARPPLLYDAAVREQSIPTLEPGQVLVKIGAVSFNRRDFWMRRGLYPRIVDGSTFGSDGAGTVIAAADPADPLLAQRVFLTPMRGLESDPTGPESEFGILGGGSVPPIGTFAEYVVVPRIEVIPTPTHLTDEQIAAWPLGGLTAWRAIALAQISRGDIVLITGIGGGVAILALQICVAMGALVYVTSGNQQKIDKAVALGAKGGLLYTQGGQSQSEAPKKRDTVASGGAADSWATTSREHGELKDKLRCSARF
ncbi:chaperonin 10-like protein [Mycena metata]|uniref:Chaperonin 10-like protein n=1 Tax=Mycena metata TaxID=1033252 RepID=A0AAD7M9G4_9AGAR|nr:chaperonin 10-like protein [Mycena metata]